MTSHPIVRRQSDSELSTLPNPKKKGSMNGAVFQKLDRLNMAIKVFAVIAFVSFIATIVLLVLAQLNYLHPLLGVYTMAASLGALFICRLISCCQEAMAEAHDVDMADYKLDRQPMPDRPKEKKNKKN